MAYLGEDLITAVRVGAKLPSASPDLTPTVLLGWADEERASVIDPWRRRIVGAEYDVRSESQTLVADTATYRIPWRASGASLHSVSYVDTYGDEWPMHRIPLEDANAYVAGAGYHWGGAYAYAIEGDFVRVLPTPAAAAGSVKMRYVKRPSRNVVVSSAMLVTGISGTPSVYTGVSPSSFSTSTPLDIIQAKPNFDIFAASVTPSAVSTGVSVTFATNPATEAVVGDYAALAGETPVIQLPEEIHPVLTALVISRALEAEGDRDGMQVARDRAMRALSALEPLYRERVGNGRRYAVDRDSSLRGGRYR